MTDDVKRKRADLRKRIAGARRAIAYVDRCEKEAKALKFSPVQMAKIKFDADEVRKPARALLQILLAELKELGKL